MNDKISSVFYSVYMKEERDVKCPTKVVTAKSGDKRYISQQVHS